MPSRAETGGAKDCSEHRQAAWATGILIWHPARRFAHATWGSRRTSPFSVTRLSRRDCAIS